MNDSRISRSFLKKLRRREKFLRPPVATNINSDWYHSLTVKCLPIMLEALVLVLKNLLVKNNPGIGTEKMAMLKKYFLTVNLNFLMDQNTFFEPFCKSFHLGLGFCTTAAYVLSEEKYLCGLHCIERNCCESICLIKRVFCS